MVDASKTSLFVFDNYIATLVDGIDAGEHKHGAHQLSISLDGRPHRCGPDRDQSVLGFGHLVAPNTPHVLHSESGQQVLFLIAPQSTIAQELGSKYLTDSGFGVVPTDAVDQRAIAELRPAVDEGWSGPRLGSACDALLETLAESPWSSATDLHASVREAVGHLHAELRQPISADDLASRVGLSTSRLLHLFKEQMGTPLRPHLQWLRLTDAMIQISNGTSVTEAAAHAGFADGAHLTRSMKQYLGLRPSDVIDHPDIDLEVCLTNSIV
jgi:AraC-like DNA-binding protein